MGWSRAGAVNNSLFTGNIDYQDIPSGQVGYWIQQIAGLSLHWLLLTGHLIVFGSRAPQISLFKAPRSICHLRPAPPMLRSTQARLSSEDPLTSSREFMPRFRAAPKAQASSRATILIVSAASRCTEVIVLSLSSSPSMLDAGDRDAQVRLELRRVAHLACRFRVPAGSKRPEPVRWRILPGGQ